MVELWDAYDAHENKLGFDLVRGEARPEGAFHLVVNTLVRHVDGDYLLMQRAHGAKIHGGRWEGTAGGSVLKGKTPVEGAVREVLEETGLEVFDVRQVNRVVSHRFGPEFYYFYVAMTDGDKGSVRLQPDETVAYRWVPEAGFLAFMEECIEFQRDGFAPYVAELRLESKQSEY